MCLNARSIVNKNNELNIMVEDIEPHIIGITESWANTDFSSVNTFKNRIDIYLIRASYTYMRKLLDSR